ncbi:hypothetical protein ZIOFF_013536 [Zingiber officinale]|uniref:Hikeshi-like C-terminal domain-containing protein n=1 Tax=Zingiber officinale TaxID=94328 RepID=A0A8J5HA62_ZINOF|nr:hypothetical protein ZIOFF_013536 [Zingiber officinale]
MSRHRRKGYKRLSFCSDHFDPLFYHYNIGKQCFRGLSASHEIYDERLMQATKRFLLSLSCDKREHGDLHEEDDGGNGDSEEGDGGNGDLHEEGDRGTAISTANLRYFFSSSEEPPIPDPNPNPLQLALTFAKIGVSVEDLASLPPVADAGAEKKAERLALRVGENLFNFMQSFCGIDGSRLVVPMDILDRWFKKFQERARKDPSYLKGFAL